MQALLPVHPAPIKSEVLCDLSLCALAVQVRPSCPDSLIAYLSLCVCVLASAGAWANSWAGVCPVTSPVSALSATWASWLRLSTTATSTALRGRQSRARQSNRDTSEHTLRRTSGLGPYGWVAQSALAVYVTHNVLCSVVYVGAPVRVACPPWCRGG